MAGKESVSKTKKPAAKKTAGKKKGSVPGTKYACDVCGLVVSVDNVCGCVETCDLICCGKQMKKKR
jgi:hypothetical protein